MNLDRAASLGSPLGDWLADRHLTPQTAKELRALLAPALVTLLLGLLLLLLVAVTVGLHNDDLALLMVIVAVAYPAGLVALGATAVGHEYVHRTVGLLLVQPASRRELLWTKLRVLLPLLAISALPGLGVCLIAQYWAVLGIWLAALLSSVLVAPGVTLLCRSALAGVVFTLALPGLLLILVNVLAEFVGTTDELVPWAWSAGLVIAHWVAGGVLGWRQFIRWEVQDGGGPALCLPWRRARQRRDESASPAEPVALASPIRKMLAREIRLVRPATWMLVKKELRLHAAVGWVAAGYAVLWPGLAWLVWRQERAGEEFLGLTAGFYTLFVPLLIGSLACAEERQLGTHGWQLTLPMAATRQWWAKAAVAVALALGLGLALPWALARILPFPTPALDQLGPVIWWAGAVVAMTILGLYASSASHQSVMALLFGLTLAVIIPPVVIGIYLLTYTRLLAALTGNVDLVRATAGTGPEAALFFGVPVLSVVLLWLGGRNHRRPTVSQADRVGQLVVLAGAVVLAGVFAGIAAAVPTYQTYRRAQASGQAWADETARQQHQPQVTPLGPMDAAFARRYGLQRTSPPTNTTERFGLETMVRYGLIPAEFAPTNSARPATPGNQPPADTNTATKQPRP